jgi:hypothetical protein
MSPDTGRVPGSGDTCRSAEAAMFSVCSLSLSELPIKLGRLGWAAHTLLLGCP